MLMNICVSVKHTYLFNVSYYRFDWEINGESGLEIQAF